MWNPPAESVKILALVRGDTVIAPPDTMHATITISECQLTGGMALAGPRLEKIQAV